MPNSSKIGVRARVHLHPVHQRRLEALHEAQHALVGLLVVHPDALERRRQLVAQDPLHHVQIVMDQHRRRPPLRLLPHVEPQVVEEHHVGAQFFFGAAFAGGAHDVAARNAGAVASAERASGGMRSSSLGILRETPMWSTVGMYTRKRPGSAMCDVMRAPFCPSGSLAI